jgi:carboxymethylenebutenolidase
VDQKVVELYDQYVHGDMPRRTFINRVARIVGGAAAAALVIPLIEPNYARYQPAAAQLAWKRTIAFFDHYLKA